MASIFSWPQCVKNMEVTAFYFFNWFNLAFCSYSPCFIITLHVHDTIYCKYLQQTPCIYLCKCVGWGWVVYWVNFEIKFWIFILVWFIWYDILSYHVISIHHCIYLNYLHQPHAALEKGVNGLWAFPCSIPLSIVHTLRVTINPVTKWMRHVHCSCNHGS